MTVSWMHHFSTKQFTNSHTKAKPTVDNLTGEHLHSSEQQSSSEHLDSSERLNRGGGGWVESRRQYIYTYTAP